jgi:hypothetical protein
VHAVLVAGVGVQGLADPPAGDRIPEPHIPVAPVLASSLPSGLNATPSTPVTG